eukprot:Em0005g1261a
MLQAVTRFNTQVPPDESITVKEVLVNLPPQRALSKKLDMHAFQSLLSSSSPVNKARILSFLPLMRVLGFRSSLLLVIMQPPADMVVMWLRGTITCGISLLTFAAGPIFLTSVGAAAYAAELRKHVANDTRCQELGWTCIPLAVETYGNWGMEAQSVFSRLASLLAIGQAIPKPKMLGDIYGHLNMSLFKVFYLNVVKKPLSILICNFGAGRGANAQFTGSRTSRTELT